VIAAAAMTCRPMLRERRRAQRQRSDTARREQG